MLRRGAVALLVVALTGCGGADRVGGTDTKPRVLTLLSPIDDPGEAGVFAEQVGRESGGRLRVDVVPSPYLDRTDFEAAAIADVRAGKYDLGWAAPRAFEGSIQALNAPLLVDSYALEDRVARDGVAQRMLGDLREDGIVGLGILPGPLRRPVGLGIALTAPADFAGRRIGVTGPRVPTATLAALGAKPVPVPVTLDASGLDGVEIQLASIPGRGLADARAHITGNVELWPRPLVVFAGAKLAAADAAIVRAAAKAFSPKMAAYQRQGDTENAGNLCRRGTLAFDTASAAQLRALRRAVAPVYAGLERDPATRDALRAIAGLKRDLAAPPSELPSCESSPAAPASAPRTGLDGTWRMDTGRTTARPEFWEENYGRWVFVFDRGRFAFTQENGPACTWAYGTFTARGDRTTWQVTDGGGESPNGAYNRPGEAFAFSLSLFRDTAQLGPVRGAVSPRNFDDKPWRKLGPPDTARFSRRCPPPAAAFPAR